MEEIVLSWTVEDICNQHLYKDEVKNIPDEFHSLYEYLESYTFPLIEETRAKFFSGLETLSEAPSAKIQHIALNDTKDGLVCSMDILANEFSGGADMYEPKHGDILILSSLKPEYINNLFRYGVTYCLAIVKRVTLAIVKEVMESNLHEVVVDRFIMNVSPTITSADQIQRCTCALYLTNIVTNSRILKALQYYGVDQNFTLIKKVLSRNQMEVSICGCTHEQNNPETTRVLGQLESIVLNQSQLEVLESTISAVQCNKSSIGLVRGPPGTGKTKTVGLILWLLKQLNIRTLTCAPTNVAVLGVCSQLVHSVKNFDGKNGDSDGQPLSMADVVLFGNTVQMDIVSELEDVFLDSRINQLTSCFLSDTNWRQGVTSMIRLLDDCISMYDIYVKEREEAQELSLGFGDYLRGRFEELEKTLNSCFRTMFVHLPRRFLSSVNCTSIVSLHGLLRELSGMLSSSVLTDEQLRQSFETPPVSIFSAQKKFIKSREECTLQLRNLLETLTLTLRSLTKGSSIKDFCLQNATLVFCTASSSFLLHNAQTSCFDVVVIDEAAQLKECESLIPLRLNHVKHALLVGDECQLPALVESRTSEIAGFGKSLFERLVALQHEKHLLNIQYRMHPSISIFPNNRFYDGKILDGPNVLEDGFNNQYMHFIFGSYAFVNIGDGREEHDDVGKSWRNWVEVAVVVHLVASLYKSWERTNGKLTIGIISPYNAQIKTIKDKIGKKYDNCAGFEVRVKSIDGFQGQEDDVVILSMVRCNTEGSVGFLYNNQRTNVAITRARHCLWIVGNAATLLKSGTVWSDIVFDAKQRGYLYDAKDVEDLAKVILNIKNELDQLADLMDPNSVLFSSTRWKVVFSNEFVRSFVRLKSKHARMGLIQMLLRLACGWRSKRRNLSMVDCPCPLARVYQVGEHCLVWSIDLKSDEMKNVYTQIIKLWNLVPLAEVEGLLKRMDYIFSMYTDTYMERCKTICIEGMIEVPNMWTDEIAQYRKNDQHEITGEDQNLSDNNSSFLEDSKVSESLVLMKFYALSSGVVKHLLMARDGSEIDIPFELNDQEMEIIQFPKSSFILGRSGTGKTTVLTTKLVRMEQQFFVASHGMGSSDEKPSGVLERGHENEQMENMIEVGFIKQVFLTVSPKLCSAIRDQVNRLVRFANFGELSGPIDSVTMHDVMDKLDEFTDIPDNFNDLTQEQYPLIITFWKFLVMLDGTIRCSFFNKFYSDWGGSMEQGVSKSRTLKSLIQSKEVNFDKFSVSYWPHFNEKLTNNMDASTVFTQIISHIKGEFGGMEGVIGREQYVALSERRFSSLSSAVRDKVYDIFLEYEKKKQAAREFDLSDFVNNLHRRLKTYGYSSCKFDFVYIDEVQDLTVSQIALLKYVSNNFREGFVFAGDTAQTIARGIDFRFEDIRSLFYKEFLSELKGKEKEIRLSDMFQLCQNFRTHIGILRLAQSVIDLLYYFFPFSIDKLNPETSLIYGDAPVLLESDGDENAITKIFGGRDCSSGRRTEFGAEQVILVRDDSAKKEILDIVGKQALVLTIIDCKGLEFQDVLLYNFFGSSPLGNKWRVLYEYLENEDILDPSMTKSYPRFDVTSHHLLCSELKQLYVAITRTKQRLWICENLKDFSKPMFNYWKRLCLVQGTQLDKDFVEAMQTASTLNDWRVRGIKLFNERQFEMAQMCFEKAGDAYNGNWARAAGLVERAERQILTNLGKAHTALQKAADIYEMIRMHDNAATCYIRMGNYMQAGTIYLEKCGTSRLEDAGDCFSMTKCLQRAAHVYFQANCFSKCTSVCLKAELFDAGLKYLEKWQLQEEKSTDKGKFRGLQATRDDYLKNCADCFYRREDYKKMMHFVKAFKSMEKSRTFLMAKNRHDELLTLEMEAGNYIEAARIARLKEDILLEARIWEKAGSFEKATRLVILVVIMESLWSYGSRGWRPKSFSKSEACFPRAKDLAQKVSSCFHNLVCSELYLWDNKPKNFSKLIEILVEAEKCKSTRLTFLSLRSLLDLHLDQENSGYLIEEEPQLDLKKWFHKRMVEGKVSLNTLIHIWVQWRDAATEVSSSLCEFSLDYLGVRKEDDDGTYCVLNPTAWWIGDKIRALLKKSNGGGYFMASHIYEASSTSYWKSEIFSVGKAVVEKLDSLLRSYSKQTFCPETRGRVSLSVYEIIKSLKNQSSEDNSNFKRCMFSIDTWFWDACFSWDSKNSATQDVLSIIECPAAAELIHGLLDRFLGFEYMDSQFTYGQLGKLSMILLLSGKLPKNQLEKIMKFTKNKPEWQKFFYSLEGFFIDGFDRVSMVVKFREALQATYEVNWRCEPDYISPHCYLYLLEVLTFFASSCLQSAGYMITTRSVLVEIMKLRGCQSFLDSPLDQMVPEALTSTCLVSLFEFIVCSVKELLCNRSEMLEWISKCSSSLPENFYHQMVLRLAIILHVAYLNTSSDFYSAGKFLSSCGEISRFLPVQFSKKLHQARNSWVKERGLDKFVDAFASVGDPLVVISQRKDNIVFPRSNLFFFFCDQMRDKGHIISVLFPRSTEPDFTPSMVNSTDIPSITEAAEVTEGAKADQGDMDESLVKKLKAFRRCEKRDIAGTVDILGVLLAWLCQNKPPKGFYDQLIEDTCSAFDNFGNIISPAKVEDGEAKLKLIIDALISEKVSEEALQRNTKGSALQEINEKKRSEDTQNELFWNELEAFQQGIYQKEDLIRIHNLLFAALSMLREKKSLINFDERLIEEMKTVYGSFSNLERGDGHTLEDLYTNWRHGDIKLKLMIDTLLTSIESKSDDKEVNKSDDKETSESRCEGKLVEEMVADKTSVGSSSKHSMKKQKANNKKNKKGRNRRG